MRPAPECASPISSVTNHQRSQTGRSSGERDGGGRRDGASVRGHGPHREAMRPRRQMRIRYAVLPGRRLPLGVDAFEPVLIEQVASDAKARADEFDLDRARLRGQPQSLNLAIAGVRHWMGRAGDAEADDADGMDEARGIVLRRETREAFRRREPQRPVGCTHRGAHFAAGEPIGFREIDDFARAGIEAIDAAAARQIDAADVIFGDRPDRLAGEAVGSGV